MSFTVKELASQSRILGCGPVFWRWMALDKKPAACRVCLPAPRNSIKLLTICMSATVLNSADLPSCSNPVSFQSVFRSPEPGRGIPWRSAATVIFQHPNAPSLLVKVMDMAAAPACLARPFKRWYQRGARLPERDHRMRQHHHPPFRRVAECRGPHPGRGADLAGAGAAGGRLPTTRAGSRPRWRAWRARAGWTRPCGRCGWTSSSRIWPTPYRAA